MSIHIFIILIYLCVFLTIVHSCIYYINIFLCIFNYCIYIHIYIILIYLCVFLTIVHSCIYYINISLCIFNKNITYFRTFGGGKESSCVSLIYFSIDTICLKLHQAVAIHFSCHLNSNLDEAVMLVNCFGVSVLFSLI